MNIWKWWEICLNYFVQDLTFLTIFIALPKFKRASRVLLYVFEVVNTIFHYDLVLISLNDKIIRYMFQAKKSNVFILF